MSLPSPSLKTCLIALVAVLTATTGLALASTVRDGRMLGDSAASPRFALGKAKAAGRRPHGVIARARATGAKRRIGDGAGAPTTAPGLVTGATPVRPSEPPPAGAAPVPPSPPATAPEAPAAEEPAAPEEPPAAPEEPSAAPEEPAEQPAPEEPSPPPAEPSTPIPSPETSPPPSEPPPQTSTPEVDPAVPVEPAPSPAASLVLGIDGGYAGWSDSEIEHRKALGAAVTRHEWDPLDPVGAQDDVVEVAAGEIHTRILALLGANDLGDPTHYREWVVAFVRRYGLDGSFWAEHPGLEESRYAITTIELGNEPYFGTMSPQDYADTVLPTLERIKELDLPVKVLLPVYLHGDNLSWLDTLYARIPNLNSLYHALAFHPYWYGHDPAAPGDSGPLERLATLRGRMNELGADAKPIYLTEYGESTADCGEECIGEAEQALHLETMIDAVLAHAEWKVSLLSVFQLIDRGTHSTDRELQFGILRQDGSPKPSYPIVRTAMQLYR
jgi:hypothetical protein